MKSYTLYTALLLFMLMSSCTVSREVSDKQPVQILLDWSKLKADETPSDQIEFHFYDKLGNHLIKQGDKNGFIDTLPNGDYRVLVFNTDVINASHEGLGNYDTAEIRVEKVTTREQNQKQLLQQPDRVYATSINSIKVQTGYATQTKAAMATYIHRFKITVNVSGAVERVVECRVHVSNLADRVNLSTGAVIDPQTNYTLLSEDLVEQKFKTSFQIIGKDADSQNLLNIELQFDNGETDNTEIDITDALEDMHNPETPDIEVKPEIEVITDEIGKLTVRLVGWTSGEASGEITQ